ncbi:trehalose-phosphatase [Geobacter pelophilus]|uniref:Trehalose 6-phosphate phosphatase n=1 Tax=Geoanaerobacter pelophilus TaxID=60036 RepID=A0AAW4L4T2_9BACT|nr:trehalose-phosphatase [Geoanaerobacter pelophilus]MBT0663595.1 trehalose-phosphatase [Geoanaerobacter pelophilus]
MAQSLFSSDGLVALARYVAPDTLFAFDLDGTLAPIVDDYAAAKVEEPMRTTLDRLINLAKVAVITGRSRKDALGILGLEPHLLIGNHGAEWPSGDTSRDWGHVRCSLKWQEQLHDKLFSVQGIEIEFKGESISLHYRKADDPEQAAAQLTAEISKLDPKPRIIGGKFVINLLPVEAFTKGEALVAAMYSFNVKRAIYVGDDVTDEEIFQLKGIDLFGIHIGNGTQTAAQYYVSKQSELLGVLNSMVGILELHQEDFHFRDIS